MTGRQLFVFTVVLLLSGVAAALLMIFVLADWLGSLGDASGLVGIAMGVVCLLVAFTVVWQVEA